MNKNYRTQELFIACPLPLDEKDAHKNYPFGINIQIRTEHGKTKWLNVTPMELKQIENVLTEKA